MIEKNTSAKMRAAINQDALPKRIFDTISVRLISLFLINSLGTAMIEVKMKYAGYIERERVIADKMHRLENIKIKGRFDYDSLQSLSTECRQKLNRINPDTLAQASRIPGVSPSDINVLLVLLGR